MSTRASATGEPVLSLTVPEIVVEACATTVDAGTGAAATLTGPAANTSIKAATSMREGEILTMSSLGWNSNTARLTYPANHPFYISGIKAPLSNPGWPKEIYSSKP